MIDPREFITHLQASGVEFFTGVPDSLLKEFCACLEHVPRAGHHIISANEGGAVALALGYHLATRNVPLVYLQNSGLGNIVNPLLSLADPEVYSVPLLLVIGWRGEPGVHDEPQHKKQGRVMLSMLDAMEIPHSILGPETVDPQAALRDALAHVRKMSAPYALVIKKGTFQSFAAPKVEKKDFPLSREEAIQQVIESLGERDVLISTTGMPSREVYEYRSRRGEGHQRDFLTVGGMGHASQIALGIALQKPRRSVYCLDGDGALLMHMGGLAITGVLKPRNFKHIIVNNGAHDSVGGQPTVAFDVDVPGIAHACGYESVFCVQTKQELQSSLEELQRSSGPSLLEVRVRCGARKDIGRPLTTPSQNKNAFMDFVEN
ncbi:Phosphonopyruvate decarboxylase [Nitrospira defluvii]|jgi:phosphonopyruvate decarboxylase|uniref:Phosphonopyruvate decarboxylase n=1 Tax=Nitrospira defluvii TaxID=330214 RepID=D8PH65_9BACT|nr:Phosphonopyruvate decarboxylase [Nitrospira defluvii]